MLLHDVRVPKRTAGSKHKSDKSVTIHSRNLQILATELYKVRNGLAPEIMNNVFQMNPSMYNLRNSEFKTENEKTVHYGTESLSFLDPKIWKLIPLEIKSSTTLQIFKNKIKVLVLSKIIVRQKIIIRTCFFLSGQKFVMKKIQKSIKFQ